MSNAQSNLLSIEQIEAYGSIDLIAKSIVEGLISGLHRSPYHGFSAEYAEHRIYNPGESTRHIDWKVYARTGRLYTKSYEEETNLRAYIALDVSSSMYYPSEQIDKIRFAVYAAASLAHLFCKQRDAVGLFSFSDRIEVERSAKSTQTHLHNLLNDLSSLLSSSKKVKKTDISKSLHLIADKIPKRSLVVVFSDFLTEDLGSLEHALQHLRYQSHEVILFHVHAQLTEMDLSFKEGPYFFYALEGKGRLKIDPEEIRIVYQKQMKERIHALYLRCGTLGMDFFSVNTSDSFNKTLFACLMKRMNM